MPNVGPRPSLHALRLRACILAVAAVSACGLAGCVERTLRITSDPPGALVWLNDVQVGRTPVETDFTYYGSYDVRVRLDGYEPLSTVRDAKIPAYEIPPIDLGAEMVPTKISSTIDWHFVLEPTLESRAEKSGKEEDAARARADLMMRGRNLAAQAGLSTIGVRPGIDAQPSSGDAGTPATTEPSSTEWRTTDPAPTTPR
ncbi:MAG: PEGA domain-containing protein [Phycisphaeraceae bacterium]|nr:PEGA domain-containing protein [Phycisphaeraceae bacterium]